MDTALFQTMQEESLRCLGLERKLDREQMRLMLQETPQLLLEKALQLEAQL